MNRFQDAIRNRFHHHDKHENHRESEQGAVKSNTQDQGFQMVGDKELEELSVASTDSLSGAVIDGNHDDSRRRVAEEKAVYEQQLTQLQEQLVAAMIENQTLHTQLKESSDNNKIDCLKEELEKEREKCQLLQQKIQSQREKKRRYSDSTDSNQRKEDGEITPGIEMGAPADDFIHVTNDKGEIIRPIISGRRRSTFGLLWEYVMGGIYQFLEDLEPLDTPSDVSEDGAPLTVKQLKENLKRFKAALTPYIDTASGINRLITWKSPAFTFLVFIMYMYSAYEGFLLPVTLFLITFRLGVNYLKYRGFNINFNYLDYEEEEKKDTEEKGMSDKFNLVLFVARKVQNLLGTLADSLEKIKNLLTCREPQAAKSVILTLFSAFIVSLLFETSVLFYFGSLYMGVKFFVIDFVYNRYPRLKLKHDTTYKIWLSLPTDAELSRRNIRSEIQKHILSVYPTNSDPELWSDSKNDHMTQDDKSFCELFSLPPTEGPLPGWHGGKRCTLINKEKSLSGTFKNGRLYLTRSFLCFERSKAPTPKNIVIPLSDVDKVEKAKPYSWMPGGGMAIEIVLVGTGKRLLFGAFLNRDESFASIMTAGAKGGQPWALAERLVPVEGATSKATAGQTNQPSTSEIKKFQNFTITSMK